MQVEVIDAIANFINLLLAGGPTLFMPLVLTLLSLALGQPFGKSLRSGITVGIGFVGIYTMINVFVGALTPAVDAVVTRFGLTLNVLDVGWPVLAAIGYAMPTAAGTMVTCLLVNVVMLALNLTMTMDIDLFNYYHPIISAGFVYVITQNYLYAMIAAGLMFALELKISDFFYPMMYDPENFNCPGLSLPHGNLVLFPIALATDELIKKIPGIGTIEADPESIRKKFGIFGETIFIGLVAGILIGVLAGFDLLGVLSLAMTTTAVMYIIPRMVGILMEGLIPVSEGARDFLRKRFPGRELIIGMDAAILVGYPSVVAVGILLIPISLFLAAVMPGNQCLPYGDLAAIAFYAVICVAPSKGNIVRGVLVGVVQMALIVYLSGVVGPFVTEAGRMVGFEIPATAIYVTSLDSGSQGSWIPALIALALTGKYPMTWLYFVIGFLAVYFACWWWLRDAPKKIAETKIKA